MVRIICGALLAIFGPLLLERYMSAAPEWIWRLLAFCCIAAGIVIVGNSSIVYPHLSDYRQHPIISALFVGIAGGVLLGMGWFFFATKDRDATNFAKSNDSAPVSAQIAKTRRATLSKVRDLVFSTKDKSDSARFDPIGALVKYSDEFETEQDVEWVANELEKRGFGNPFQELEGTSQFALRGQWLQFLQEARLGIDEIKSAQAALAFAESKWSDAAKFRKGREAALEQLRTEDRRRIETNGSQVITPSGFGNSEVWVVNRLNVLVRPDQGTAPFTHTISLITKEAVTGAVIDVRVEIPQSANPTIEIRNGDHSGPLLNAVSGNADSATRRNFSYRFDGAIWTNSSSPAPDSTSILRPESNESKMSEVGTEMFYNCLGKIRQGIHPLKALQDVGAYKLDANDDLVNFCNDLVLHGATNPYETVPLPEEHWLGFLKIAVGRDLGTADGLLAALDDVQTLPTKQKKQARTSPDLVGPFQLRIDALPAAPNTENKTQLAWTLQKKPAFDAGCIFSVYNPNLTQGVDGVAFRLLSIQPPFLSARGFDPITEDSKLRRLKLPLDTGEILKGDQTGQVCIFHATRHPMGEPKLDNIRIEFGEKKTGQPVRQFIPQTRDHTITVEVAASGLQRTQAQFNIEFCVQSDEPVFMLNKLPL
jgi:hypothetical protein